MEQLRKEFYLEEDEVAYLDSLGITWETIAEGSGYWLLLHHFPIPTGYNIQTAIAAIQLQSNYLVAGLDMVYFTPSLYRIDNVPIRATEYTQMIDQKQFQRWSRHRTGTNPWRPGVDNLSTHIGLIEEWLLREFKTVSTSC
ncbi:E2/UBC family protein [Domibacillus epiphyticus]|uniref:Uncharacterized protein n=1 Tax=Domibacillus epiphyticus TaxID=1714355 RepID=A0A1V2ACI5_9BACI|nr:E2/UBC family protein [Domibacillus epiphyticus]OMP68713.1 hypothetical protein BTO28_01300 [Domibacillus epiphyticus]